MASSTVSRQWAAAMAVARALGKAMAQGSGNWSMMAGMTLEKGSLCRYLAWTIICRGFSLNHGGSKIEELVDIRDHLDRDACPHGLDLRMQPLHLSGCDAKQVDLLTRCLWRLE